MKIVVLLVLALSSFQLQAQHGANNEGAVNQALEIQKDMLASRYDAGEDCSELYHKNKAKIQSSIDYYKRTLAKNPPKGSSSEPYTLYGYLLGLKGRCEKDRGVMSEAFDQLELALKLGADNKAPDEKALGFVSKVINGFMEKSKKGNLNGGFGMERAAKGAFERFKPYYEGYFRQMPEARRDGFFGPRIQSVYQAMLKR